MDVFAGLAYLVENVGRLPYDADNVTLVGHSVGAWMALACVMEPGSTGHVLPMPTLARAVQQAIKRVVLVVGAAY